jgi:hypothetical protein
MTYTVVGMEKVSVPAGTFDSVKVVGKGRWVNTKATLQDVNEDTFWYAPAVRGIVRFIQTRWERGGVGLEVTEELVKYNLSGESVAK